MTSKQRFLLVVSAAVLISGAVPVSAAVLTAHDQDIAPGGASVHDPYTPPNPPFNPSSTDLLTGISPTLTQPIGNYTREDSAGPSVLNDGSVSTVYAQGGPGGDVIDHAAYSTHGEDEILIWDLGGAFNLTEAVVYGGWNDGGRDQTFFGFDVSTDGGLTYNRLTDANVNASGTEPISHRVRIFEDTAPFIATGVTHIQFDPGGVENGWTGYTEIDVFGAPVPEPMSIVLCGFAGLVAIARRNYR
ncbi:MAG: hypothetical protein MI725_13440 [Pirellulales bacterium]|nr:hypothetical protein [Pirellulales bacterium]